MREFVFVVKHKEVEIKGLATQDRYGNIEVGYYHPTTGELQESLEHTLQGWKFQDEALNEQMRDLIRLYQKHNDVIDEWIRDYFELIRVYIGDGYVDDILVLDLDENGVWAV